MTAAAIRAAGHETKPPARYTEATLVRELEEREIGRPSTYASIIGTILNRGYVYKKGTALVPAWLAFSVTRLLEEHFPRLVSYEFTAGDGGRARRDRRRAGATASPSSASSTSATATSRGCTSWSTSSATSTPASWRRSRSATGIDLRVGRYGPYVEDGDGNRGNVPEDLPPDELTVEKAKELLANPAGAEQELGVDPDSGLTIVAKNGRYGPYVTEVLPEDAPKSRKPRTSSLFKSMNARHGHPRGRAAAAHAAAGGGRRPGDRRGDHRAERPLRPLPQEGHRLALDRVRGAAAHDHARGGAADLRPAQAARPGGGEPGPRSSARTRPRGAKITVKAGRFGAYVTDGEYNATIPRRATTRTRSPSSGPPSCSPSGAPRARPKKAQPRRRRRKKTTAKKTTAKKTAAKKTTTKKAAAKKS